ncbi:MAG TPA: ATP-binding protein [Nocardioidaceae bacterium]|nr:ATP-binding protein [Nocardioidaceae bacterium]
MSHTQPTTRDERVLRVRLAADPASVPGARRFVAEGLRAWGHDDLVDDAALCVSELAGNAALHGGSTYIEVCVLDLERAVRVYVEDDGPVAPATIAPRTTLPGTTAEADAETDALELLLDAPATGRGLAIVSVLSSDWGVEELEQGKRVWAELSPEPSAHDSPEPSAHDSPTSRVSETATISPDAGHGAHEELPEGWVVVRLAGCPVRLSLHQDQHLDELVRELKLISANQDNPDSGALARRLEAILRSPAQARAVGRRQAQAALARGERLVDVEMAMPREFSAEVRRLDEAVREADVLCEERRLLTLASTPELRAFRAWMVAEIRAQVERGASPVPWEDWNARD